MKARPYQVEIVDAVLKEFETVHSTLVLSATGTGKTIMTAAIIEKRLPMGRCMVIAHREELIYQAVNKIGRVVGIRPDIEMAGKYAQEFGFLDPVEIVVGTVQTLNSGQKRPRYERFDPTDFSTLIVDECHHSTSQSYLRILNHFRQNKDLRIVGFTATADRSDNKALGQVFESAAYTYDIRDATDDGWLVPISQEYIQCSDLDFSGIRTTAGDLNGGDLSKVMEDERILHEMVWPTIDKIGDKKAVFFAQSIAQAQRTAEIFNRHRSGMAECVFGKTPKEDRKDIFRMHGTRFQVLVNVGVLTEGYDDPEIEAVVCGRPTKSRSLYTQMVGRGTRPLDGLVDPFETADERKAAITGSTKPHIHVIDFVGNSGRHKLISSADVLGGDYDAEVVEWAKKTLVDNRGDADMAETLKKAKQELDEKQQREEEERRRKVKARARYRSRQVDAFGDGDRFASKAVKPAQHWYFTPATEKQRTLLMNKGLNIPDEMTVADASKMIDAIAKNRWRVPPELEHLRRGKAS